MDDQKAENSNLKIEINKLKVELQNVKVEDTPKRSSSCLLETADFERSISATSKKEMNGRNSSTEKDQKCLEEISNEPTDEKKEEEEAPTVDSKDIKVKVQPSSKGT